MTKEHKELLFKDLCSRVPYGVKVQCEDYLFTFDKDHMGIGMLYQDFYGNPLESPKIILSGCYYGEDIKPYLFPLSSMTEEQKEELKQEIDKQTEILIERMKNDDCGIDCGKYHFHSLLELEWCIKNHFDYRGLIPLGLAIDATGLNIY